MNPMVESVKKMIKNKKQNKSKLEQSLQIPHTFVVFNPP